MTTESLDTSGEVAAVATELSDLMRTTKGKVAVADFPSIAAAAQVQREVRLLGLQLETGDELCTVLRALLKRYQKEHEPAAKRDYPLAGPALALLGLTPETAYKTIGPRRKKAATKRGVSPRTMRNPNHEAQIAHEVAIYLTSTPGGSDDRAELADQVRRAAIEFVQLHQAFLRSLIELRDTLQEFRHRPDFIEDTDFHICLQALGPTGYGPPSFSLATQLEIAEIESPRSRMSWLARVIRVLDLPKEPDLYLVFERRGRELLRHAYEKANGNLHLFLVTIEEGGATGRRLLSQWQERLSPRSRDPLELSALHLFWLSGLGVARRLVQPEELTRPEAVAVARWLLDNGRDVDKEFVKDLVASYKDDGSLIEDTKDTQRLLRQSKRKVT